MDNVYALCSDSEASEASSAEGGNSKRAPAPFHLSDDSSEEEHGLTRAQIVSGSALLTIGCSVLALSGYFLARYYNVESTKDAWAAAAEDTGAAEQREYTFGYSGMREHPRSADMAMEMPKEMPPGVQDGAFMTSEKNVRRFQWTWRTRSVKAAMTMSFPRDYDWKDWQFKELDTAQFVTATQLHDWVEKDLLGGPDPFTESEGTNKSVPIPWPTTSHHKEKELEDQLGEGHFVAYSRRQVCYIAARSLVGSNTAGYANGLLRFLQKDVEWARCSAQTGEFGKSLWGLLAACAADPALKNGRQGPILVVAKAKDKPSMQFLRNASGDTRLLDAGLRVCRYGDGGNGTSLKGIDPVPQEGCKQPTKELPGRDFMTGGLERLRGQAIQDISAKFVGGYIFGSMCGLGGGQDERLLVYMPEVLVLSFFLSEAQQRPQIRVPVWVLGARMIYKGLDGTGRYNRQMIPDVDVPLAKDVVAVQLNGKRYGISSSRPFLAFMSENQGFLGEPEKLYGLDVRKARRNKAAPQRDVNPGMWYAFQYQVRAWYTGVALSSYHESLRPTLETLVKSIGSGPWLAGLWWGDSHLGFLASWLGHAIASRTWGSPLPIDYYLYASFTENPGNQCLMHSKGRCEACLKRCIRTPLPHEAFWLPEWGLSVRQQGATRQCAGYPQDCGKYGIEDIVARYGHKTVEQLWNDIEKGLNATRGKVEHTVFDILLDHHEDHPEDAPMKVARVARSRWSRSSSLWQVKRTPF
eukprot:TRINITY_DN101427_c0_g1_i1.p1 TRINITY_DN101427_c0_g1~~TRINITY_DN101427_c0_g1_i1.p1  ORF type:complete len:750 (+),score=136.75 TRINITY_DN101427_c0_g1_i1:64-2313(+)